MLGFILYTPQNNKANKQIIRIGDAMNKQEIKAILTLSFCAFMMILVEFSPISLLTDIAQDFNVKPTTIGATVSIYAVVAATFGLLTPLLFKKTNRKWLLLTSFILVFIANTLLTYSNSLFTFLICRAMSAITHGIFWAIVTDFAIKIVATKNRAIASSAIFSSIPIATLIGIPLLNYIGHQANWHSAFLLISITIVICCLLIIRYIPHQNTPIQTTPIYQQPAPSKNKQAWLLTLVTSIVAMSHFCAYTYIEPYIRSLSFFSNNNLTLILLIFGLSGLIGNFITMKWMNDYIEKITFTFLILFFISMLFLFILGKNISFYQCIGLIFIWGMAASVLFTTIQTWIIIAAKDNSSTMAAFSSAIFNYSIAIGSLLGAWLTTYFNLTGMFLAASILIMLAILQLCFILLRVKNQI